MNGKIVALIFFVFLLGAVCVTGVFSEELRLEDIISRVLKNDESLQIAEASITSAYQGYRITRSRAYPQINLYTDPIFGLGLRRDYSFDEFPPETRTTLSNSFNLGIELAQQLPTGGILSTEIGDTFQYNIQLEEEDLEQTAFLTQKPEFTLNYNQPLFVNRKFIDGQLTKAANKSAEIGWQSSKEAAAGTKNAVLLRATGLYLQLLTIERNRQFLQEGLELARQQLEQAVIDEEQGRASANQVLGLEVAVNRQQEGLLDTGLAKMQTQNQLGLMIGLHDFSGYSLKDTLQSVLSRTEGYLQRNIGSDPYEKALSDNPDILTKRFDVESKRLQSRLNDTENAPAMNLFFTMSPRYPDEREDEDSFATSFSDFFHEDAGINMNFGLSFNVPITDGGAKKARRAADETAVRISELNIRAAEKSVTEKIMVAQKKDELLRKRLELLEVDVEYQQNRLEREIQLAELNTSTIVKVDTIRLDLLSTKNQIWQTKVDILNNLLELLALTGEPVEAIFQ